MVERENGFYWVKSKPSILGGTYYPGFWWTSYWDGETFSEMDDDYLMPEDVYAEIGPLIRPPEERQPTRPATESEIAANKETPVA